MFDVKQMYLICRTLITIFILATVAYAQEFSFNNLRMPVFGETGHREQMVTAESGFGHFDRPILKGGVIEFYTSQGNIIDEGSRLSFDEATYLRGDEVIEGSGLIRFTSREGEISGEGFRYDLTTGRLSLHSHVSAQFENTEVTGESGEAVIVERVEDEERRVYEAVITGNVVATGVTNEGVQIEKAETSKATYTGDNELLILSSPVRIWTNGRRMDASADEFRIDLSEKPNEPEERRRRECP